MQHDHRSQRPLLLILSGPAGSGKTTLCDRLTADYPNISRVVTTTTRTPRPGERDGCDYHFVTAEDFLRQVEEGAFYEHATVHGRHYGTYRHEIDSRLKAGADLLLNIDVQGAASFRAAAAVNPELARALVTIFILPPSLDELKSRLDGRGTDDSAEIQRRLENAQREIALARSFDFCIPSGSREHDYQCLSAIYLAETMRNTCWKHNN